MMKNSVFHKQKCRFECDLMCVNLNRPESTRLIDGSSQRQLPFYLHVQQRLNPAMPVLSFRVHEYKKRHCLSECQRAGKSFSLSMKMSPDVFFGKCGEERVSKIEINTQIFIEKVISTTTILVI
ncbi:hypothetical protein CDAR_97861 [Caerostris darwini]|uniref:Uncharacterized protein n=1 Tax=Caerostris darwini TaxID=1538125 RepID=A0AAV4MF96_9ARAC|nr:hypothetical protein CDAR_97861 [Caerostris darwini]